MNRTSRRLWGCPGHLEESGALRRLALRNVGVIDLLSDVKTACRRSGHMGSCLLYGGVKYSIHHSTQPKEVSVCRTATLSFQFLCYLCVSVHYQFLFYLCVSVSVAVSVCLSVCLSLSLSLSLLLPPPPPPPPFSLSLSLSLSSTCGPFHLISLEPMPILSPRPLHPPVHSHSCVRARACTHTHAH